MLLRSRRSRAACVAAAAWAVVGSAASAPPQHIEPFDAQTWQALRVSVDQRRAPSLVMFSATWCAVCPGVAHGLAHDPRRGRAPLIVVMIDVAPGDADAKILGSGHYAGADRVMAFDGNPAAIRHAVDRRWRGVVPHVAWLAPGQPTEFVQGLPDDAAWRRWEQAASTRPR